MKRQNVYGNKTVTNSVLHVGRYHSNNNQVTEIKCNNSWFLGFLQLEVHNRGRIQPREIL